MRLSPRLPWYALLAGVVLVPLAVGVIPLVGTMVTLNAFVQAKLIVLALVVAVTLGSWAIVAAGERRIYTGPPLTALALLVLAGVASAIFATDQRIAIFGDFEQGVGLLVLTLCAAVCFLTAQLVRDNTHLRELTTATVFTAAAVATFGLLQQLFRFDILGLGVQLEWMYRRGWATIGNPDSYAAYLVIPAILALHRTLRSRTTADRVRWGVCLGLVVTSVLLAQTKAPWLGVAFGGLTYWFVQRRASRAAGGRDRARAATNRSTPWRWLVPALIAIGAVAFLYFANSRDLLLDVTDRFSSLPALLSGRSPLWQSAVRIASEHPFLGIGPDSFRLGWYATRPVSHLVWGVGLDITDPHSAALFIAATLGIVGLLAVGYLLARTFVTAFSVLPRTYATRQRAEESVSDYPAWFAAVVAMCVTLLASMVTSVLLFMLFLGLGVLMAPALKETSLAERPAARIAVLLAASVLSLLLAAFGALTLVAQVTAVGARVDDADLAWTRAQRAATIAPWDTTLRDLRQENMIRRVLDHAFTDQSDASALADQARSRLQQDAEREPADYRVRYRLAKLLIGSGPKLGDSYTTAGIDAGLDALRLYPNSLEMRTGIASGYMALNEPAKAVDLLEGIWDADPNYPQAGLTYAEALAQMDDTSAALSVVAELAERFPDDTAVQELQNRLAGQ